MLGLTVGTTASDEDRVDDRALLAAAIGLNAGAIGGVITADDVAPSIGRVRFLDLGAAAGGLVFGGLYVSAAGDDADIQPVLGITARTASSPVVRVGLVPSGHGAELAAFGSF